MISLLELQFTISRRVFHSSSSEISRPSLSIYTKMLGSMLKNPYLIGCQICLTADGLLLHQMITSANNLSLYNILQCARVGKLHGIGIYPKHGRHIHNLLVQYKNWPMSFSDSGSRLFTF